MVELAGAPLQLIVDRKEPLKRAPMLVLSLSAVN
jgi:hypothetical protein